MFIVFPCVGSHEHCLVTCHFPFLFITLNTTYILCDMPYEGALLVQPMQAVYSIFFRNCFTSAWSYWSSTAVKASSLYPVPQASQPLQVNYKGINWLTYTDHIYHNTVRLVRSNVENKFRSWVKLTRDKWSCS